MKKLAISFITYNRAKHIKEDLDVIAQPTQANNIDIYIYDGSTNIHTECVVKKYIAMGFKHIHYFHTLNTLSKEDSAIQRLSNALFMPDAEYVWLCGDKFVIKPEYYSEILSYVRAPYDIITIYGGILKGTKIFDNPSEFVDYAIVPITHFGSTIIKKELIKPFSIQKAQNKVSGFGIQLIYLKAISNSKMFNGIVIDGGKQVNILSQHRTRSSSLDCMWDIWIVSWHRFISLLPSSYDSIREGLFNRPDRQMGFFSLKELFRQRSEGQFDWKKNIEYRKYVKKVISLPNIVVFLIAIFPQDAARWIYNHMR